MISFKYQWFNGCIFTECDEYSKYVTTEVKIPPEAHGILKGVTTKPSEFPHMVKYIN